MPLLPVVAVIFYWPKDIKLTMCGPRTQQNPNVHGPFCWFCHGVSRTTYGRIHISEAFFGCQKKAGQLKKVI
jgi:hypothetical protein